MRASRECGRSPLRYARVCLHASARPIPRGLSQRRLPGAAWSAQVLRAPRRLEHFLPLVLTQAVPGEAPASSTAAAPSSGDAHLELAAAEVGLASQLHSLASQLSGGQRRKLSVALALLGSPAVVFLDVSPGAGGWPCLGLTVMWRLLQLLRSAAAVPC